MHSVLLPFYRTGTWSVATSLLTPTLANADVVTDWNDAALDRDPRRSHCPTFLFQSFLSLRGIRVIGGLRLQRFNTAKPLFA